MEEKKEPAIDIFRELRGEINISENKNRSKKKKSIKEPNRTSESEIANKVLETLENKT